MSPELIVLGVLACVPGTALLVGGILGKGRFALSDRLVGLIGGGSMAVFGVLLIAAGASGGDVRRNLGFVAAAVVVAGVMARWLALRYAARRETPEP